ncbi:MAG: DEAD/DEAH box helicase, partial [Candidatus Hodarchaeota archaeon]
MEVLDPSLVRILNILGIKKLNDLQTLAAEHGFFDTNDDFAIVSMSRTGKSFAGALLAANELFKLKQKKGQDQKEEEQIAIFITPFHAFARDFFSVISKYFGWFLKPFLVLEEAKKAELLLRITKGNPPNVIIATPEAMQRLLRNEATKLWFMERRIVTVVFDDVHSILQEPSRGIILLEIVPFFRTQMKPKPRIIALSAKFNNPERLETLFGTKLIEDQKEYDAPRIKLVKFNAAKEKKDKITELLHGLTDEGTTALVFLGTISQIESLLRENGDQWGQNISYDIDYIVKKRLEKIGEILEELDYYGASFAKFGVGSSHGMMDETQRWFIEWAFRRRYIRLLFGTQALGYGVNTPVKHVIMGSPGVDELFRQSMMSRAVWMRRGKGQPGTCTIFTKTDLDLTDFERVFMLPEMFIRPLNASYLSNYLIGMIGLDILRNESDRAILKSQLCEFFKWASTTSGLKRLTKVEPPIVKIENDGTFGLTKLGKVAFKNNISGEQANRIIEGIRLLEASGNQPAEFDLLLIMNYAASINEKTPRFKYKLNDDFRSFLEDKMESSLARAILNTEKERDWRRAFEYSTLAYISAIDYSSFDLNIRKNVNRLFLELKRFSLDFRDFLDQLLKEKTLGKSKQLILTLEGLLDLMDS